MIISVSLWIEKYVFIQHYIFRRLEFRVAENHWRSNHPSLVEEVDSDGGGFWLPLESEVLDVLRLVPHHRDEGVLVQVQTFDRQHRRRAHVKLGTGWQKHIDFVGRNFWLVDCIQWSDSSNEFLDKCYPRYTRRLNLQSLRT